jgi:hypothetical protein
MWSETWNPLNSLIKNNTSSYSKLHNCTFPIFKETIKCNRSGPAVWISDQGKQKDEKINWLSGWFMWEEKVEFNFYRNAFSCHACTCLWYE